MVGPVTRVVVMLACWMVWWLAFPVRGKWHHEKPVKTEPVARWGILLQMTGYLIAMTHGPTVWGSDLEVWRLVAGIVLAGFANALLWGGIANLGKQWRVEAGLNEDHELVQSGAYRVVRHPIYASMFGMFLASLCWIGTFPGAPVAVVLFVAGTEIRVRVEDALLLGRFGARFVEWQQSTPAYLPFVR